MSGLPVLAASALPVSRLFSQPLLGAILVAGVWAATVDANTEAIRNATANVG